MLRWNVLGERFHAVWRWQLEDGILQLHRVWRRDVNVAFVHDQPETKAQSRMPILCSQKVLTAVPFA